MGYTTDFTGQFTLDRQLSLDDFQELNRIHNSEDWRKGGSPDSYCQWKPTPDGRAIEWDGAEKFYYYVEWIQHLIDTFLVPRGYVLNGEVEWSGEERSDVGTICVVDNTVTIKSGSSVSKELGEWLKTTPSGDNWFHGEPSGLVSLAEKLTALDVSDREIKELVGDVYNSIANEFGS